MTSSADEVTATLTHEQRVAEANDEIAEFECDFTANGGTALLDLEKAILRTFILWQTSEGPDAS